MTEEDTWNGRSRKVIVAYTGRTDLSILKFLKPGFRHCFAIVEVAPFWVVLDGLSDRIALAVLDSHGLARYLVRLHAHGYKCQFVRPLGKRRSGARLRAFTCVEVVKRLIGVSDLKILTPFHLYRHLRDFNVDK